MPFVEVKESRNTAWRTTRLFCFSHCQVSDPITLKIFLTSGSGGVHPHLWLDPINLELQSKTQMTELGFHQLRQHHLIFCQILIKVEGNQRDPGSRERMGFDAALSRTVGTHSWMEIEKIIVVPSGCVRWSSSGQECAVKRWVIANSERFTVTADN